MKSLPTAPTAPTIPTTPTTPITFPFHSFDPSPLICCEKGLALVPSRNLTGWGNTWAYFPIQEDELGAEDDPLSRQIICCEKGLGLAST